MGIFIIKSSRPAAAICSAVTQTPFFLKKSLSKNSKQINIAGSFLKVMVSDDLVATDPIICIDVTSFQFDVDDRNYSKPLDERTPGILESNVIA